MNMEIFSGAVNTLWLFIGGILVFFMQAGFAMVETGFTRAKNAGNITMKNCVDFLLGSVVYWIIGYGLMYGTSIGGVIGIPFGQFFMNSSAYEPTMSYASLFFQTVFCATTATIVSGAMAERTNFKAYVLYSFLISLFIYPIAGHWVWSPDGWLSKLGFHDFAGSGIVHSMGGTLAFVGAAILGPRIGKYKIVNGKKESCAIPGHNIVIGALGVFILWFCWFGFNPSSTQALIDTSLPSDSQPYLLAAKVFITTNLSACAAATTALFFTWKRYGKPDVSMTLNGVLAGLVGITASCDCVSPLSSLIIGIIAGIIVTLGIEFIDTKLHIDDPVGAVAVHGLCGAWGVIAVGIFANDNGFEGLITGNFQLFATQLLGEIVLIAWAALTGFVIFKLMNVTGFLRANKEDELTGLDATEHGLPSAYADFMPAYKD